jgi:outer membrane protein TolC
MRVKFALLISAIIFGFARFAYSQAAAGATQVNLQGAIDLALQNNEQILMSRNDVKSARARIREAWADALPEVNFTGAYTRNFRRPVIFLPGSFFPDSTGVPSATDEQVPVTFAAKNTYSFYFTLDQPIFQAGKISAGIRAARLYDQYSDRGFEATRTDLALAVKKAFYAVLLNQQLLEINRQSLEQSSEHLVNTRKLFLQGQVAELDTLRAWVDYANLQPPVIWAENNLKMSINQLKELMGLELRDSIGIDGKLEFGPTNGIKLDDYVEQALEKRPELKQLELQAGIYKENVTVTRSDLLPKLSFRGVYQYDAQSERYDFGAGLQNSISGAIMLQVPIFNGFRNYAKIQQAKLDYNNSRLQVEMFEDQLKIEVESILSNMEEAAKRVYAQEQAITQAERALYMAERQYNEGVGTRLELGDARLALNQTKTNYIRAVYDHKVALAELDKAIGRE